MAIDHLPDCERWGDPSSYKEDWASRAEVAAAFVPDGVTILEIGVGTGNLRKLIQHRCHYVGADLEPLDRDTRSVNLDSDPLPHASYDAIATLGVIEYLHRPREALEKIAAATNHIIISYCCAVEGCAGLQDVRRGRKWVNDFTEMTLQHLFASLGFEVVTRRELNGTADFLQVLFDLRRKGA